MHASQVRVRGILVYVRTSETRLGNPDTTQKKNSKGMTKASQQKLGYLFYFINNGK
jgi:hypothetical protein